jgi:XTP/dITP diphosphohydrolase
MPEFDQRAGFVVVRTVVLATGNQDKVREMRRLFESLPVDRVVAASDLGPVPEVIEDGETLAENALKKAREFATATGEICVADDTGLEVDALGGAPGIYAARYAGPDATYEDNWRKLQAALVGVADRGARFRTVMAVVDPVTGFSQTVDGVLEGLILEEPRGDRGFGYDPLFFVPAEGRGLAEMSLEEKNEISHRACAARAMVGVLEEYLD